MYNVNDRVGRGGVQVLTQDLDDVDASLEVEPVAEGGMMLWQLKAEKGEVVVVPRRLWSVQTGRTSDMDEGSGPKEKRNNGALFSVRSSVGSYALEAELKSALGT